MTERRNSHRHEAADRRQFPRPSLALNLVVLCLAIAFAGFAALHRTALDQRFERIIEHNVSAPAEVNRIKSELSQMEVSEEELRRELEGRLKQIRSLKGEWFYLSIDTTKRKAYFNYGDRVLRETNVAVGPPATVTVANRTFTFVPLKGASHVVDTAQGLAWRAPGWAYALSGAEPPRDPPRIENGLGKFVLFLPNNYVIHSPPAPDSPLKGVKPGSFMLSEEDFAAVWPRVQDGMPVYIF